MASSDGRPVFVVGTGRCGSTLLHEVLAQHPEAGFITNLDDLGVKVSTRRQNDLWRQMPARISRKGGARFAPSEGYRMIAREVGPTLVDPVRDLVHSDATPWLQERMREMVQRRVRRLSSEVFMHKFTGWPRTGFLDAVFPDAVFVEVVRDPLAVANSWLQMPWWRGHRGPTEWHFGPLEPEYQQLWEEHDRSFPVLAAIGWARLTDAFMLAREQLAPDRWLKVQYEDLLVEPTALLGKVVAHIGLDWDADFERRIAKYSFTRERTDAYKRALSPDDVASMRAVLGARGHAAGDK